MQTQQRVSASLQANATQRLRHDAPTSGRRPSTGAAPPQLAPESVDPEERRATERYLERQFAVLRRRHSAQNAILLRVVADHCAHAVALAKRGALADARTQLTTLDGLAPCHDVELRAVHGIVALPAWALVEWREQQHARAQGLLRQAIELCGWLAGDRGHDYLTGKRIHLAANTGRVLVSQRQFGEARACVRALRAVLAGDRSAWCFASPESLVLPLVTGQATGLARQLDRVAALCREGGR